MNSPGKNHPILTKYKTICGIQLIMYLNKPEVDQIAQKIKKNVHPRQKFKLGGQRKGVELVVTGPDTTFQQGTTHTQHRFIELFFIRHTIQSTLSKRRLLATVPCAAVLDLPA